jgi:hypothetical protein
MVCPLRFAIIGISLIIATVTAFIAYRNNNNNDEYEEYNIEEYKNEKELKDQNEENSNSNENEQINGSAMENHCISQSCISYLHQWYKPLSKFNLPFLSFFTRSPTHLHTQ